MKALLPDDPRWIGPHHMIAVIGRGGMGRVLLGRTPTGKLVAVKQIPRSHTEDLEFRARFQRELETGKPLTGVHIGAVVDSDLDADRPWLATEYLPAPDLATVIAEKGPLPLSGLRLLATGLATTLLEVHRAVLVHRNLKPGNVLVTPEGPRLIDFGIARPPGAEPDPTAAVFQAPEQAEGQPVTSAADLYAAGMLLLLAATGSVSATPDLQAVPHSLRKLVESCLAADPAHRPSARQMLEQAERIPTESAWPQQVLDFLESHRVDAEWWASSGEQETRYRDQLARLAGQRRRTIGWAAAGVVGLLVVGGVAVGWTRSAQTDGHAQPRTNPALDLTAAELRLLDVCAVLDKAVAGKLGTRTGDPQATPEGGCATTVADAAQRKVHYTFDIPDHAIGVGQLTPTGRTVAWAPILSAGAADNKCDNVVVTQSGDAVALRMSAEETDPAAQPGAACTAAEQALVAVVQQLTEFAPQRQLPPGSVLRLDPCTAVRDNLIREVAGELTDHQRTPHACTTVGRSGWVRVDLVDQSRPDRGEWTYETVRTGEFTAYVTGARSANDCYLTYLVRPTEKDNAEQLKLTVSDLSNSPDACGKAEKLLADAIPRLPK
ncbi:hypothetical protein JMUB6875_72060 [Nocardia sp. JMUB6875]|uniref:serine/threonine-protein kinase n=1 Tax=Nocardia sp. JMUB6875 TaxID=3158170 RepID=UPI0032E77CA6